jgi:hypothetical protein
MRAFGFQSNLKPSHRFLRLIEDSRLFKEGFMQEDVYGLSIGLITIILSLSIPIVVVVLNYLHRIKLLNHQYAERLAAIEKGIPIPPDPVMSSDEFGIKRSRHWSSPLLWGFIAAFIGAGLWLSDLDIGLKKFHSVIIGLGLALLIYTLVDWLSRRNDTKIQ